MKALKNDVQDKKPQHRYTHPEVKRELALAMMAGAIKYSAYNFMKGHTVLQLLDALERHLDLYRWGEDLDKDCTERLGQPVSHLGCILACVNMLCAQRSEGTLIDDRYKKEVT